MFDLLPNNHANQSQAKTRHRAKCTGAVVRGKKKMLEQGSGQEGIMKKKGVIKDAEGHTERPDMSSIRAVEMQLIAHLYHGIRLTGINM